MRQEWRTCSTVRMLAIDEGRRRKTAGRAGGGRGQECISGSGLEKSLLVSLSSTLSCYECLTPRIIT